MIGMVEYDRGLWRWQAREGESWLHGRRFWQVTVPTPKQDKRAARLLRRAGVRTLLPRQGQDKAAWHELGLTAVPVTPFCREQAALLALAGLKRQGREAEQSVIALRGAQVTPALQRAAMALAPQVKGLALSVGRGGDALAELLYDACGMGILSERGNAPAAALEFSPVQGERVPMTFRLYGEEPELCRARFSLPGLALPEGYRELDVLAALWQCGGLEPGELTVEWT